MAGWCSGVLPVWWVLGWGWLPGAGIGDTPAWWWAAAAVVVVVVGWLVGAPLVGGGMLSGFWGSAPWLPGLSGAPDLLGGSGWVWVGWL